MNESKPTLAPIIKGLSPGLPEIGRIKVGRKGKMITSRGGKKFQMPERLDHFLVTTLERGPDGNFTIDTAAHRTLGEKPTEIPVSLLYNDPELNFQCRWACFTGTTLWCTGDGETAIRKQKDGSSLSRSCPCKRSAPDFKEDQYRCKTSGVLSVILESMETVGGVFKFRTSSYNSVVNIMSSLALIQRVTGGVLAGIPLVLSVRPKTIITPNDNKTMTVHIVGISYKGTLKSLADMGYQMALENAEHRQRIEHIETIAKGMIEATPAFLSEGETEADIAEEFYPESVIEDSGAEAVEQLPDPEPPEEHSRAVGALFGKTFHAIHDYPYGDLEEYLETSAAYFKITTDEVRASAIENPEDFMKGFERWADRQAPEAPENGKYGDKMSEIDKDMGTTTQSEDAPTEPTIESLGWNPLMEPIQKRYEEGKKKVVMALLDERGVEYNPGWPGPQLHSELLSHEAKQRWADRQAPEAQKKADNNVTPADDSSAEDPAGDPAGNPFDEKQFTVIPADEGEALLAAEKAERESTATPSTHKEINMVLKRTYPKQWESARNTLKFGFVATTEEAAAVWNTEIDKLIAKGVPNAE